MERTTPVESLDLPKPWEIGRRITRAQWEKHREYLMSFDVGYGCRPDGWWLYEKNMQPPAPKWRQTLILHKR